MAPSKQDIVDLTSPTPSPSPPPPPKKGLVFPRNMDGSEYVPRPKKNITDTTSLNSTQTSSKNPARAPAQVENSTPMKQMEEVIPPSLEQGSSKVVSAKKKRKRPQVEETDDEEQIDSHEEQTDSNRSPAPISKADGKRRAVERSPSPASMDLDEASEQPDSTSATFNNNLIPPAVSKKRKSKQVEAADEMVPSTTSGAEFVKRPKYRPTGETIGKVIEVLRKHPPGSLLTSEQVITEAKISKAMLSGAKGKGSDNPIVEFVPLPGKNYGVRLRSKGQTGTVASSSSSLLAEGSQLGAVASSSKLVAGGSQPSSKGGRTKASSPTKVSKLKSLNKDVSSLRAPLWVETVSQVFNNVTFCFSTEFDSHHKHASLLLRKSLVSNGATIILADDYEQCLKHPEPGKTVVLLAWRMEDVLVQLGLGPVINLAALHFSLLRNVPLDFGPLSFVPLRHGKSNLFIDKSFSLSHFRDDSSGINVRNTIVNLGGKIASKVDRTVNYVVSNSSSGIGTLFASKKGISVVNSRWVYQALVDGATPLVDESINVDEHFDWPSSEEVELLTSKWRSEAGKAGNPNEFFKKTKNIDLAPVAVGFSSEHFEEKEDQTLIDLGKKMDTALGSTDWRKNSPIVMGRHSFYFDSLKRKRTLQAILSSLKAISKTSAAFSTPTKIQYMKLAQVSALLNRFDPFSASVSRRSSDHQNSSLITVADCKTAQDFLETATTDDLENLQTLVEAQIQEKSEEITTSPFEAYGVNPEEPGLIRMVSKITKRSWPNPSWIICAPLKNNPNPLPIANDKFQSIIKKLASLTTVATAEACPSGLPPRAIEVLRQAEINVVQKLGIPRNRPASSNQIGKDVIPEAVKILEAAAAAAPASAQDEELEDLD